MKEAERREKQEIRELVKRSPHLALKEHGKTLTTHQFKTCLKKEPWAALAYAPEQIDDIDLQFCLGANPKNTISAFGDRLTKEMIHWCLRNALEHLLLLAPERLSQPELLGLLKDINNRDFIVSLLEENSKKGGGNPKDRLRLIKALGNVLDQFQQDDPELAKTVREEIACQM